MGFWGSWSKYITYDNYYTKMIEKIGELESKGFRVSIFPQRNYGEWLWSAGVYVGNCTKAEWVDTNNGLPRACYNSYIEALESVIKYCENYKEPKKKPNKR